MRALLVTLTLLCSTPALAGDVEELMGIYHRLQDEIVRGVAGADGLRNQLHGTIADRIDDADGAPIAHETLAQFALSGGRARRLRHRLRDHDTPLSVAIRTLLRGEPEAVRAALAGVPTAGLATRTRALVALNLALLSEGPLARDGLLQSAALAPGTIIEEAALRRIALLSESDAAPAARYWRRFAKSPYGAGLNDALLAKLATLSDAAAHTFLDRLLAAMPRDAAARFAVAWTRRALLAARPDAARTALQAARAFDDAKDGMARERDRLIARVSDLATSDTTDVLQRLSRIDPAKLRRQDRAVLAVSKRVANAILAPLPPSPKAPFRWQDSEFAGRIEQIDRLLDD